MPIAYSLAQIVNVWHAAAVVGVRSAPPSHLWQGGRRIIWTVAAAVAVMMPSPCLVPLPALVHLLLTGS